MEREGGGTDQKMAKERRENKRGTNPGRKSGGRGNQGSHDQGEDEEEGRDGDKPKVAQRTQIR